MKTKYIFMISFSFFVISIVSIAISREGYIRGSEYVGNNNVTESKNIEYKIEGCDIKDSNLLIKGWIAKIGSSNKESIVGVILHKDGTEYFIRANLFFRWDISSQLNLVHNDSLPYGKIGFSASIADIPQAPREIKIYFKHDNVVHIINARCLNENN
ncbi:hypothetical protein UM48_004344 [Salmonella enterica subsp. enterica]|nr:hypothetical protein [Salmonella enterica subsp. enterica]